MVERIIIWIYLYLSDHSCYRFVDSTAEQFRADAVLKVIADVSLAHCGADRHRSRTVVFMGFSKFVHRSVDHADLRSVAVSDGNGCAFLYQVCDHFSRTFYGNLLFRKGGSKCTVAKRHYNFFLHHIKILSLSEVFAASAARTAEQKR